MKLSPDGKLAYIGDWNTGTISVVETTKYTVVHTIATVPFSVDELAVNQDGSLLLVVNAVTHAVDVYSTANGYALLKSTPTDATTEVSFPEAAISPDGQQLYFTSDGALQRISLVPVNNPPMLSVPSYTQDSAGVLTGHFFANDPDNDHLTYGTGVAPSKGTITFGSDGSFVYTPSAAARHAAATGDPAAQIDTFTVTVTDGRRGFDSNYVMFGVPAANVVPIGKSTAGPPSSSTGIVRGTVTATDKDKDGLTFSGTQTTLKGTVVVDAKGKYVYTPNAAARHAAGTSDPGRQDRYVHRHRRRRPRRSRSGVP